MATFFDRNGAAVAYPDESGNIFSFSGKPLAYLRGEHLFAFDGTFLGWSADGWLRDKEGDAMLFSSNAAGGPMKPFCQFEPFKGFREFLPFKGFQEFVPFKPFFSLNWSDHRFW